MRLPLLLVILLTLAVAALAQPVGTVSPTSLNFGSVFLNETSSQKIVEMKNTGDTEMVVSKVSVASPFAIVVNKCAKVKPGALCTVKITYTPQSVETDSGTLTFTDNGSNSPQTVSLAGDGINYKALYEFRKRHGANPYAGLIMDAQGNLYGTTSDGGSSSNCGRAGCGTVFKLTPSGTETVLHGFSGYPNDGAAPQAPLIMDAEGNLYGTTMEGGSSGCDYGLNGCGTIFKLTPSGTETVLHSFSGYPNDGAAPVALIMDAAGNFYGTTAGGGADRMGTVFKLTPSGTETVLYSFCSQPNCTDGWAPRALIMDAQGNLYGTTASGGSSNCDAGCGTVFKLTLSGTETVLHSFSGYPNDGYYPDGALIVDAQGNLYGTTGGGGSSSNCDAGCGTVFKLTPSGTETVLYNFTNSPDGAYPYAGLIMDAQGNLYGTTSDGGSSSNCSFNNVNYGCGTVFKLTPSGTETVLHNFTNSPDGAYPYAGLIMDAQGNLYGTTSDGGSSSNCSFNNVNYGCGTVFKLTPSGTETVLHNSTNSPDGAYPADAGLITDAQGNLYGTTPYGGSSSNCQYGCGTVFKMVP